MARENSKESILEQAVQLASVRGLNGLTIGQLADTARMSKGGICAHFSSKSDLQVSAVERATYMFRQEVIAPVLGERRGLPRVQALIDSWFRYSQSGLFRGGCFFTNAILELDDAEESPAKEAVRGAFTAYREFLQQLVTEAVKCGDLRRDLDVGQFVFELGGIQTALLVRRALGEGRDALGVAVKAAADLVARSRP